MTDTLSERKRRVRGGEAVLARRGATRTRLGAGTPDAAFDPGSPGNSHDYLDRLALELASWNDRVARACDTPLRRSREARIEHRKRILVSKVRIRTIERRLADMRGSQARFASLRPGLLLLWNLLTSGIERDEAAGRTAP